MALSFSSNWGSFSLQNLINQDLFSFPQTQAELDSSFFFDFDYATPSPSDTSIDPLFQINNNIIINDSTAFLPNFYSTTQNNAFITSLDEEILPPAKRRKTLPEENHCRLFTTYGTNYPTTTPEFSNGYVPNPSFIPELLIPEAQRNDVNIFPSQAVYACGNQEIMNRTKVMKRGNSSSGSSSSAPTVSAQSVAARERRRKITEKTQELGKLIPGGSKMNTAEMFQAAFKYVKFLQAQVALLQLMASVQEQKEKSSVHMKELQVLASPSIQEKLYSEEKCLAPKELVQTLANDHEIQSKAFFKDIKQYLLQING